MTFTEFVEDMILPFVTVAIVIVVIWIMIFFPINYALRKGCESAYSQYEPQYGYLSGCRIMWNGVLTPTDMVKNVTISK